MAAGAKDGAGFGGGEEDPYQGEWVAVGKGAQLAAIVGTESGGGFDDVDRMLATLPRNDDGNARRLVKRHGTSLMYVQGTGWHFYNGLHWSAEQGEVGLQRCAKETIRRIFRECKALQADKSSAERFETHAQWAIQSGNAGKIKAMGELAAEELAVNAADVDADPFLFYTPNASLRIHPNELMVERDPAHHVTKIARAEFQPGAVPRRWLEFIDEIFPDENIREFAQRAAGYSMTGDMSEEIFLLCWGRGRNGKGTFLRVLAWVLGTYASSIPVELLLQGPAKTGNEPSPQYASLVGVRFAIATEPGPGSRFNEGEIKTLTGRDTLRIRGLWGKPFNLVPTFKLWIACNDRPIVRSASDAYWRRVKLIPFVTNIPDDRTDRRLEEKLRAEASGILNWMLEGRAAWAEKGLAAPEAVLAANTSYRDEMDPLQRFLVECTVHVVGRLERKKLWGGYLGWCEAEGEEPVKPNKFGMLLSNKGYRRARSDGTHYCDLALTPAGEAHRAEHERRESSRGFWRS